MAISQYEIYSIADFSGNPISSNVLGQLRVTDASTDIFGSLIAQARNPQFSVNFSLGFDSTLTSAAPTGSGAATFANGGLTLATTAVANSGYTLTSIPAFEYRSGFEWYIYFTAAFTSGGAAGSHQRIGLYNTTDGFFIGYEGTTWGITQLQGGAGWVVFPPTHPLRCHWHLSMATNVRELRGPGSPAAAL